MLNPRFSFYPYLVTLLLLIGIGLYGYNQFELLQTTKEQIKTNMLGQISAKKILTAMADEYGTAQTEVTSNAQKRANDIELIFPSSEEITNLTREFDIFFTKNNFSNSPIFLSNLTFANPLNNEEWDYTILPVKMNIESSETNFYKFLDYIENSGSFQNQLRLMSIKTIDIKFSEQNQIERESSEAKTIEYTVDLNAYFKKQITK